MSWLYGITRAERLATEQLTGSSLCTIEIAAQMLYDTWYRYFSESEQKELDSETAAELGRSLYAVHYMIDDAVTAYHCALGHYDEDCVKIFRDIAKRYEKTCKSEELTQDAMNLQCKNVHESLHMDDESAIEYLSEIIRDKKKCAGET